MIVLDTHVWVWWLNDPLRVPPKTLTLLNESMRDDSIRISSISTWEILLLADRGRVEFTMDAEDWIAKTEALPYFHFVPIDNAIAIRSVRLPGSFHKDPADRIIVATAMILGATLITADARILRYSHVKTHWK